LANWPGSRIVGIVGIILLLVTLWAFAERADQIAMPIGRRLGKV
jgi:hypothetical protein